MVDRDFSCENCGAAFKVTPTQSSIGEPPTTHPINNCPFCGSESIRGLVFSGGDRAKAVDKAAKDAWDRSGIVGRKEQSET